MSDKVELLQGTLDLIVLRALSTMGPQHAYGLASRLEQVAEHPLMLNQGTLYPALVRLEQKGWIKGAWQRTESNREAKYYSITRAGTRALEKQAERWRRLAGLVDKLLLNESNDAAYACCIASLQHLSRRDASDARGHARNQRAPRAARGRVRRRGLTAGRGASRRAARARQRRTRGGPASRRAHVRLDRRHVARHGPRCPDRCGGRPDSLTSPCSRWRSASAPTPPSSA